MDPIFDVLPALVERGLELGGPVLRLFILRLKDLCDGLGLLDLLLLLCNLGSEGVDLILEGLPALLLFFVLCFSSVFVGDGHLSIICSRRVLFQHGCNSMLR